MQQRRSHAKLSAAHEASHRIHRGLETQRHLSSRTYKLDLERGIACSTASETKRAPSDCVSRHCSFVSSLLRD